MQFGHAILQLRELLVPQIVSGHKRHSSGNQTGSAIRGQGRIKTDSHTVQY